MKNRDFPKCKLPEDVISYLDRIGEYPCDGCNINREECGGTPSLSQMEYIKKYDKNCLKIIKVKK